MTTRTILCLFIIMATQGLDRDANRKLLWASPHLFSQEGQRWKITFYFPCGIQPSRLEATPHTELGFLSSCNRHLPRENTDSERLQDSTEQGHRNALTASYLPLWAFLPVKGHPDPGGNLHWAAVPGGHIVRPSCPFVEILCEPFSPRVGNCMSELRWKMPYV